MARYAGQPNLAKAIEIAVRAQQNNDEAVESAVAIAKILEKVVLVSPWVLLYLKRPPQGVHPTQDGPPYHS